MRLQDDLNSIYSWSVVDWKVFLNALKCAICTYEINNSPINYSTSYQDLGILVNSTMSWSDHIRTYVRKICLKAYRSLHIIKRNIPAYSSSNLRKKLYLSMVRSHLFYGSQLWCPLLTKDVLSLEKIQYCGKIFFLQDYNSDYKARLLSLNLLPITSWLELQDLLFLVKCLLDQPDNFNVRDYICFSTTNTRSSIKNKLVHKFSRTSTWHINLRSDTGGAAC